MAKNRLIASVESAVIRGIKAQPVTVEVSVAPGIPGINIVGMPSTSVLEARHRLRCAFAASGFELPRANVTINLVPADLSKTGTGLDLPMAIGILVASRQLPQKILDGCLFVGEVGLQGEILPVKGELAYGLRAKEENTVLVGSFVTHRFDELDVKEKCVSSLQDLRGGLEQQASFNWSQNAKDFLEKPKGGEARDQNEKQGRQGRTSVKETAQEGVPQKDLDFKDVVDQETPKRALTIAAAGGFGTLMVGPPGAGKTMLAKRMPTILDELGEKERIETALIHSIAGADVEEILNGRRPFQAPHHTITPVALVGGGRPVIPGAISLAHNGVLFLDELPEFSAQALQVLRQPIEEGVVRIVRNEGSYVFPSRFLLLGAANPCPCGYLGDAGHICTCSPSQIAHYQSKMGGPLGDRVELIVDVFRPDPAKIINNQSSRSTREMRDDVLRAKAFCKWRLEKMVKKNGGFSEERKASEQAVFNLSKSAKTALEAVAHSLALGGRALKSVEKVARVIADMDERIEIEEGDILEASLFRPRNTERLEDVA